jgi:type IV secretion system protein VirB11
MSLDNSPALYMVTYYLNTLGLADLLAQERVEDLAIQEPGVAWLRQAGDWYRHDMPQLTLDFLSDLATVCASMMHYEHGEHRPILDIVGDINGMRLRFHVNAFPTVPLGTISITARKLEGFVAPAHAISTRYKTQGWNKYSRQPSAAQTQLAQMYHEADSGDQQAIVAFLCACVRSRQNMLFVGHTGSSKSTLMTTLCAEIPQHRRLITVEDAAELTILNPNHVRLIFERDDLATAAIDAQTLLQCGLRMHPDIMILGEARGREAWTFVADVVPPHPGSMICVHGNSPASGLMRMMDLCKQHPAAASYDDRALARRVAAAVDVIIPLEQEGKDFHIRPIWFAGAGHEHDATATALLGVDG